MKASHLVRAVKEPMLELKRPEGPTPFEEGFDERWRILICYKILL